MAEEKGLIVFEGKGIRRLWYNDEWYYSVIDIIAVLTEQEDFQTARKYWNKLSQRLREEGSEVVTNCHRLKLIAKLFILFNSKNSYKPFRFTPILSK